MKLIETLLYGKEPKTMLIKKRAHTFTFVSAIWGLVSLYAALTLIHQPVPTDTLYVALLILGLQAILVVISIYYWLTEKKRHVKIIESGIDVDIGPVD